MSLQDIYPINDIEDIFDEEDVIEFKNVVNNFVKAINPEITFELETRFAANLHHKHIYIGFQDIMNVDIMNINHDKLLKEKGFEYHDFFIFALLHEIGHIETIKHLSEEDLNLSVELYDIQVQLVGGGESKEKINKYINIYGEKRANEWAQDFEKHNKQLVIDFTNKFYTAFTEMVEGVTD